MIAVTLIPTLQDNYSYLLEGGGSAAIVDPAEAGTVKAVLERNNLAPALIVNTHHHADHIGGNAGLKDFYGCRIAAPSADLHRIPGVDIPLKDGDMLDLCGEKARIIATPGHTTGHICLYLPDSGALFCGDTLFAMGCGRLFEGTAEQMWDSLSKIAALPDDTKIYCGHEYTLANGLFALTVEPDNDALRKRMDTVRGLRESGLPTLPSTLALEKETNPFLRAGSSDRFGAIRRLKDRF